MIIAAGIDPGARAGLAVIAYPGDLILALAEGTPSELERTIGRPDRYADPGQPFRAFAAVEDQFVTERADIRTAITIGHRAGEWRGFLRARGWKRSVYVFPQTWRAGLPSAARRRGSKRKWSKADSVRWARILFRLEADPSENAAEALLIARWAARNAAMELTNVGA